MAEYWGLAAICKRMSWKHPDTPIRQMKQHGYLMMKRRRGQNPRMWWYTDDNLIRMWMMAQCEVARDRAVAKDKAKHKTKQSDLQVRDTRQN